jgi:hypothetical protein
VDILVLVKPYLTSIPNLQAPVTPGYPCNANKNSPVMKIVPTSVLLSKPLLIS